jgi:hypothetical protein
VHRRQVTESQVVEPHRHGVAEVDLLGRRAAEMAHTIHFIEIADGHALVPPDGDLDADIGLLCGAHQGCYAAYMDGGILDLQQSREIEPSLPRPPCHRVGCRSRARPRGSKSSKRAGPKLNVAALAANVQFALDRQRFGPVLSIARNGKCI